MAQDARKAMSYQQWNTKNTYHFAPGTFALPVAEEPPTDPTELSNWSPVVVVRAHADYAVRESAFNAEKAGGPPVVPAPKSAGRFSFVGGFLDFPGPTPNATASTFDWKVSGSYLFVQTLRSEPSDGFVLTDFPFPLEIQRQNQLTYGQGANATTGPVAVAGQDVKTGYAQAQTVSFSDPYYNYNTPTYFPGNFFGDTMLNGGD